MKSLLIAGVAAYAAAVGALWAMQDGLIFPVAATVPRHESPPPEGAERLELATPDGETIVGHLVRRPGSRGLVLGFQGNAWHADDFFAFLAARLLDRDVAVFHYRGYAPSTGHPSEAALVADAVLVHDVLRDRLRPQTVLAAGFSLGSGVAAQLAARRSVDGLLLVTPFDSMEAVARAHYHWVPVRALLAHPFRSDEALAGRAVPAAIIAAGDDQVVPPERSRSLGERLARLVFARTIEGASHQDLYRRREFDDAVREAVAELERAGAAPLPAAAATAGRPST